MQNYWLEHDLFRQNNTLCGATAVESEKQEWNYSWLFCPEASKIGYP
jgi:hypothetical protein